MKQLTEKAKRILNDEGRIQRRDRWFSILGDLFEGRENPYLDERVMTIMGFVGRPEDPGIAYTNPEQWVVECLEQLSDTLITADTDQRFAPACIEYPIYGVHFIDKLFGADVFYQDDQWNARYLLTPVGELKYPDLEGDETWALAKRAALAFLDQDVALPLFGMPTLSSALNIIVNLYGSDALLMMLEEPEAVEHDMAIINDVIMTLHRWYRENVPEAQLQPVISWCRTQPPGYGQLCGCTMQLISGMTYRDIVAPLDDRLLSVYPHGGMIHLCGSHAQHIEIMRDMPSLKSLQLNDRATQDLEAYFEGLREDQILYVFPCEGMSVKRAIEITGGRRLVICDAMDAPRR